MNNRTRSISRDQLPEIAEGFKRAGWTSEQIAAHCGWSDRTVRRALKENGYVSPEERIVHAPDEPVSEGYYSVLEDLHIEGHDVAICSDIHLPTTRFDWLDEFTRKAKEAGIKKLIIAGDLFDQSSLNRHDKEWKEAKDFESEMALGALLVRDWLTWFDHIYILRGNHDVNYVRNMGWVVSFAKSMRMLLSDLTQEEHDRITIVDSDSCYVHNDQGMWMVAHTYQFSKVPGKIPSDLAMIHKECVGVIGAHRHHYGLITAPNGGFAIEAGHFSDSQRLAFTRRHKLTFGKTAPGGGVFLFKENPYLPLIAPLPARIGLQAFSEE